MIGDYIILKRRELNLKRKELAEKLDISYCYLNLIETNKRKIGKQLIPKLAKVLEVSEDEINYSNTTSTKNGFDDQKKIIKKQINTINKEIAKIETDKLILEKERDFLCEKLAIINSAESNFKEGENIEC